MIYNNSCIVQNPYFTQLFDTPDSNLLVENLIKILPKHFEFLVITPNLDQKSSWNDHVDILSFVHLKEIAMLRNKQLFLIFDSSTEAMDPIEEFAYWRQIEYAYKTYNIDPNQIIYTSCNLQDNYTGIVSNIDFWIYSEIYWQNQAILNHTHRAFEAVVEANTADYYFSSLNKNTQRRARNILHHELYNQGLLEHALFSQNVIPESHNIKWPGLPVSIDSDFYITGDTGINTDIFDHCVFHLTLESSQCEDHNKVLISEKTFKPMLNFTPQIIFGIPRANDFWLYDTGFKPYSQYFSKQPAGNWRSTKTWIVDEIKTLTKQFDTMTKSQLIDWKFKDETTLKHNYAAVLRNSYNRERRNKFGKYFRTMFNS